MIRAIETDDFGTTRFTVADWQAFDAHINALAASRGAATVNRGMFRFPLIDEMEYEHHRQKLAMGWPSNYVPDAERLGWVYAVPGRGLVKVYGCDTQYEEMQGDALDDALVRAANYWNAMTERFSRFVGIGEHEESTLTFDEMYAAWGLEPTSGRP